MNEEEDLVQGIMFGFCNWHSLAYSASKEGECPKCLEEDIRTICGCTGAGILAGATNPCYVCGHANGNHNFGKGCRVYWSPKHKGFYLADPDVDYTKYKRIKK